MPRAPVPNAVLLSPVVILSAELLPTPTFASPVVFANSTPYPTAVLRLPSVTW